MVFKLDKKDIMILWALFNNSRIPLSVLSKKIQIPKPTVKYRIDQLMKNGVLNKNFAIIDMSKFNFLYYEIFIKLQGMPKNKELQALEKLKKNSYLGWLVTLSGRFNIHCAVFVKKPSQFYQVYEEIKSLFYPYIKELNLNMTVNGQQFNYPFFRNMKPINIETKSSKIHENTASLNKLQIDILKILTENCRTPTIDIANKLKTTEKTIRENIRKLEKNKIILNYTCQLHPGRSGYFFYIILIRLNNYNMQIEEFLKNIPEIFYMVKGAGFYDLKAEFYVDKESRIYEIEQELHEKLGKIIAETNVMQVHKEHLVRYFTDA